MARLTDLLGPLETEVMEIIWRNGSATVFEVEEIVNDRRNPPLAYKTLLTICARLTEKGLLSPEKEGRAFRYVPTMTEVELVAAQATKATDNLLKSFGDLGLSTFIDQMSAEPERLDRLRRLLDEHEGS
jgi:predicted transcriptional regulator